MGQLYLPPLSPIVKAARGWPTNFQQKPLQRAIATGEFNPSTILTFQDLGKVGSSIYDAVTQRPIEVYTADPLVQVIPTRFGPAFQGIPDEAHLFDIGRGDADDVDNYPFSGLLVFFSDEWEETASTIAYVTWYSQFSTKVHIKVKSTGVFYEVDQTELTPDTTFELGKVHTIAFRITSAEQAFYHNGQLSKTSNITGSWSTPDEAHIELRYNSSLNDMKAHWLMVAKFRRRALSNDQLRYLSLNPYSLLEPANQSPYPYSVPDAVGGIPTLSAADMINLTPNCFEPQVQVTF